MWILIQKSLRAHAENTCHTVAGEPNTLGSGPHSQLLHDKTLVCVRYHVRRSRHASRTALFPDVSRHGWTAFEWAKLIVTRRAETLIRGSVERSEIEPDRAATPTWPIMSHCTADHIFRDQCVVYDDFPFPPKF